MSHEGGSVTAEKTADGKTRITETWCDAAGNSKTMITEYNKDVKVNITGTDGKDNITINGGNIGKVDAGKGNDIISVIKSTVKSIFGGAGDDTITVSEGSTIENSIYGDYLHTAGQTNFKDQGNDNITINDSTVKGNIWGQHGDDAITLNGTSKVTGTLGGYWDNDTITLNGSSSAGNVLTSSGKDHLNIHDSANVTGTVWKNNNTKLDIDSSFKTAIMNRIVNVDLNTVLNINHNNTDNTNT